MNRQYIIYFFENMFLFLSSLEKKDKIRKKESFENYKKGYGYIDHDEVLKTHGVFIDEMECVNNSIMRSERARIRLQNSPEIKEMQRKAREIVNRKNRR